MTVAHFDDDINGVGYFYPTRGGRPSGTAVVATTDGGSLWHVVGALPRANQYSWSSDQIGYAFDPDLAITTNGGRSWRSVPHPGSRIVALAPMHGQPWAAYIDKNMMRVSALANGGTWHDLAFAAKPLDSDPRWISLIRINPNVALISWDVVGSATRDAIIPAPQLAITTDAGAHWQSHRVPCGSFARVFDAATPTTIWMICGLIDEPSGPVAIYTSHDLGEHWQVQAANDTVSPTGHTINVPPGPGAFLGNGELTAVSDSVAYTNLDRGIPEATHDGGRTWTAPLPGTAPEGFFGTIVSLDTRHAWISQSYDPPRLWRTIDGGHTWQILSQGPLK